MPRILAFIWLLASLPAPAFAFAVPPNDGFVTDVANILSESEETQIEETLTSYKQETSNEIAVLIVQSLGGEAIADVAVQIGRKWGVGTKEKDNGILILVSYEDREVFIATGYGLEGAIPDIVAKGIIDEEIVSYFRDGDYAGGIAAGFEALKKHIGGEYTAERYSGSDSGSGFFGEFFSFWGLVMILVFVNFLVSFLGKTKSWWLGGIFGAVAGIIIAIIFSFWIVIPFLAAIGFLFDFMVSKYYKKIMSSRRGRGGWTGGGWGGGGSWGGGSSGSSSSSGGFSGGSFGGGGAGGKW